MDGMAVSFHPVRVDAPGNLSQDVTGQVWHSDPGQNQEPHVIGHQVEICLPCLSAPADKVISGGALLGCRTKEKAGKGILLPVKNHILHILSHCAGETQIMVSSKQAFKEAQKTGVPSAPLRTGLDQLDAYGFKFAQRAGNGSSFMWHIQNRDLAAASTGSSPLRQSNVAALL
jgi:hypothetical protein